MTSTSAPTTPEAVALSTVIEVPANSAGREGTPGYPAEHDAAHPATGPGADTPAGETPAHRLVWLDPATLAVHPRNVRGDLGDLSGLAASISAQGVLEALTVVPTAGADGTTGHQLVAGHRRAAAAVLAGISPVPCVLRPDLALDTDATDGDRAGQATHVGAMLAENTHRQQLTAVEEARGVQTMLDLGASVTRVAKTTGLGRRRVAKAAGVARLDTDTAAAVDAAGLTLDQAAAVAVYADDPDTAAALIGAAGEGPGRFAHALTRAKQAREEARQVAALTAELAAAGRTVLDPGNGVDRDGCVRLTRLAHDGQPLTAEAHTACPGAAVLVTADWNGVRAVEVCTDPAGHGHTDRWAGAGLPGGGSEPSEQEKEQAKAERKATVEGNKAMSAATEARREFVRALLARRTAAKGALRFAVETLATDPRAVARWLGGMSNQAQDQAAADLGLAAPGFVWGTDRPAPTLTSGEQIPDARLTVALLAHVAAAIESGIHRQSWRNPDAGTARWLRFLVSCGYTLADVEQGIVDAVAERAVGIPLDAGGGPHTDQGTDQPTEQD